MSLMRRVAELIQDRGPSTVDDLVPFFDGYTRKQVLGAMQNAAEEGWIHSKGRVPKSGHTGSGGSLPAAYVPGPSPTKAEKMKVDARKARSIHSRPPASVWELAHGRQIAGTWPPKAERASRYAPLGDWPDYQPRSAA